MNFDDLEDEEVDTKYSKVDQVNKDNEESILKNKKCRLTPLTILEQEYLFNQKIKEAKEKIVNENKNQISITNDNNTNNNLVEIKKNKAECLNIFDENQDKKPIENGSTNLSLQDNFKSFLNKRKQEKQRAKVDILNSAKILNPDQLIRDKLRQKFIDQAFKYIGIPYSKKYYVEGDKYYDSPLFLDCCGLIRRCINDLNEEFGITLFGWNQTYQYDILPEEITLDKMKPGDLVFYSATFYDNSWKKQHHDLVHVEIFLGGKTGEETIAAREPRGVVSVFDTYQFTSSNYHSIVYRFKSIETWLKGIHKSFCNEHKWHEELGINSSKYSLFNFVELAEEKVDNNK